MRVCPTASRARGTTAAGLVRHLVLLRYRLQPLLLPRSTRPLCGPLLVLRGCAFRAGGRHVVDVVVILLQRLRRNSVHQSTAYINGKRPVEGKHRPNDPMVRLAWQGRMCGRCERRVRREAACAERLRAEWRHRRHQQSEGPVPGRAVRKARAWPLGTHALPSGVGAFLHGCQPGHSSSHPPTTAAACAGLPAPARTCTAERCASGSEARGEQQRTTNFAPHASHSRRE